MSKFLIITIYFLFIPFTYGQRDLETITKESELKQYILSTAPSEDAFVAVKRLAKPYIDNRNWKGTLSIFQKYKEYFPEFSLRFEKIMELLESPTNQLTTTNLSNINTKGDEYFPVINIAGTRIYFTGSGRSDNISGEDIFYSDFENGQWNPAKPMGKPFNTKEDDAINSVSADGNILVLFGNYKGAIGGGDNFYVERKSSGWSSIIPFPKPVNSVYWDCDGFLTADGKAYIFASERKGGIGEFRKGGNFFHGYYEGNTDIYVSMKTDTGWSSTINLGSVINTPFTERSPFLHPDGKTVYFSSDGHYGLGGLDVFKSVRLNDTSWTEWSEPVNLGKDINTSEFDIAYKISTDGKLAYFSSNRPGGKGGYDLYSIILPQEAQPFSNVITIKGKVTDENLLPLDAELKWVSSAENKTEGILRSNPETGDYIITLPVGKDYQYYASKQGYYSVSNSINLISETTFREMTVDIILNSIQSMSETPVKLNNIYFDFDKYDLKAESLPELDKLYNFLVANENIKIEISAHTDGIGAEQYNLTLSQKRAQSVVTYIINKGISSDRLIAVGYGKSRPVASNDTEAGRALNRRVEMRVIK